MKTKILWHSNDPLIGAVVQLPGPDNERALVLDIEHEYDDGTTLRYVSGPCRGQLTMRDTFAVRRWPIVDDAEASIDIIDAALGSSRAEWSA